jgi:hypothetical protein
MAPDAGDDERLSPSRYSAQRGSGSNAGPATSTLNVRPSSPVASKSHPGPSVMFPDLSMGPTENQASLQALARNAVKLLVSKSSRAFGSGGGFETKSATPVRVATVTSRRYLSRWHSGQMSIAARSSRSGSAPRPRRPVPLPQTQTQTLASMEHSGNTSPTTGAPGTLATNFVLPCLKGSRWRQDPLETCASARESQRTSG